MTAPLTASFIRVPVFPHGMRARTPIGLLWIAGLAAVVILAVLATLRVSGQEYLWENGHWTVSAVLGALVATWGARRAVGADRAIRAAGAAGLWTYSFGQVAYDVQFGLGFFAVPAPSDALFLSSAAGMAVALLLCVRHLARPAERQAVLLDAALVAAAIAVVVMFVYSPIVDGLRSDLASVFLLYPIAYFGVAGTALIVALATRTRAGPHGLYAVAGGFVLMAVNWVWWLEQSLVALPPAGSLPNLLSSVGCVAVGLGLATLRTTDPTAGARGDVAQGLSSATPVLAGAVAMAALVAHLVSYEELHPPELATLFVVALALARQSLLLRERTHFLGHERDAADRERQLRESAQAALDAQEASDARYRSHVDTFTRLGELMTFAANEDEMLAAAAGALERLVPNTGGDILLVTSSRDQLTVALAWGAHGTAVGDRIAVDSPLRCLGIRRGSPYVVEDASDPWLLSCPAHPVATGATMCAPMLALGQVTGVIHLEARSAATFDLDAQRNASRVAEQVALAIANARLVRTMEGLALKDSLTGLHNGRFFDPFLERELARSARDGQPLALIAIDLDHFKSFNDTHGHPAGDEALRTFARVALRTIRASDTIARMGGEEFIVALPGADLEAAAEVAEKLRAAIEEAPIHIGTGRIASVTASFGVASTDVHPPDRMSLVRIADHALYAAKRAGRNRVVVAPMDASGEPSTAA